MTRSVGVVLRRGWRQGLPTCSLQNRRSGNESGVESAWRAGWVDGVPLFSSRPGARTGRETNRAAAARPCHGPAVDFKDIVIRRILRGAGMIPEALHFVQHFTIEAGSALADRSAFLSHTQLDGPLIRRPDRPGKRRAEPGLLEVIEGRGRRPPGRGDLIAQACQVTGGFLIEGNRALDRLDDELFCDPAREPEVDTGVDHGF